MRQVAVHQNYFRLVVGAVLAGGGHETCTTIVGWEPQHLINHRHQMDGYGFRCESEG